MKKRMLDRLIGRLDWAAHTVFFSALLAVPALNGCASGPAPEQTRPAPTQARARRGSSPRFLVSFAEDVHAEPLTGRVLLFLSRSGGREPRFGSAFSNIQPVYAIDVNNLAPGQGVEFTAQRFRDPNALAFPGPFNQLPAGTYSVQALFDIDQTEPGFNVAGNLYSAVGTCELRAPGQEDVELVADRVIEARPPQQDTDRVKLVEIRSELLSAFYGREFTLRAGVVLPTAYDEEPDRQFPTLYSIPGFGGSHTSAWWSRGTDSTEMLRVVLDPTVPLGHSVFANSANNGPVGDALVQELIPEIERRFRAIPHPYGRLVTGHSSGGWASLWLQVAYPDFFGGCWSLAPDPVDFTHFQTMNLYDDRNGHWTDQGYPRPLSRSQTGVTSTFIEVNRREYVVGYGFQLDSFNAVFSPRGEDGQPQPVMNKLTGAIDHEVAAYWRRYDIRQVLEKNWMTLGPKLKGKLHVVAGGWDTYYLNAAAESLGDFLATTDYQGYVEVLPGNHSSFRTEAFERRLNREMAEHFAAGEKAWKEAHASPEVSQP